MLASRPLAVDKHGTKWPFCPGKATWYPEIQTVFDQCLIAKDTSILPKPGLIADQDEIFTAVFGYFLEKYSWRGYGRVWQDVGDVIPKVLEAIAKMLGAK